MKSGLRFERLSGLLALALFSLLSLHTAFAAVLINEVRPWSASMGVGDPQPSLFELYNTGADPESLDIWWWMSDTVTTAFPAVVFPPATYLIIVLATGTDDSDFTDGVATFHANVPGFTRAAGELAVFRGLPDATTIEDFVNWGVGGSSLGTAYSYAVSAGIWPSGGYVEIGGFTLFSTLGRVPTGYDNNAVSDWLEITSFTVSELSPHNPIQLQPDDGRMRSSVSLLRWKDISGVTDYLVEVDDTIAFTSPVISETVTGNEFDVTLADGEYYWRVIPQGIGSHPAAVWFFAQMTPSRTAYGWSSVPQYYQHKDSRLLCIWDLEESWRPGCWEEVGSQGPWDNAHSTDSSHIVRCRHCSQYCARASIQMISTKFGGTLLQDEISYRMKEDDIPGRPEGDLGHNQGAIHANGDYNAYSWALMGAAVTTWIPAVDSAVNWTALMTQINADRPILAAIMPGHAVVFNGYFESSSGRRFLYKTDPWPGSTGWFERNRIKCYRYYTIPAGPLTGRTTDPNVADDGGDGDGVMNFDEGHPDPASGQVARTFESDWDDADTDDDEVRDKQEIRAYTFHDWDHAGHDNNALTFPDVDGDSRRAENDCDSDNDGDFDGGEDINGDGHNPSPASETCMFGAGAEIGIIVLVAQGIGIGYAYLFGQTLHASVAYPYEVIGGCPTPQHSQVIGHSGSADTDANGAFTGHHIGTFGPGIYRLIVDVLRDNYYTEPDNWDPWTCFSVAPAPPVTGLVIRPGPNASWLNWRRPQQAWCFKVHASDTYGFTPSESNRIGTTEDTVYVDSFSVSMPTRRFYCVMAQYYEGGELAGPSLPLNLPELRNAQEAKAALEKEGIPSEIYESVLPRQLK
jgi:hypothetical protein